MNGSGARTPSPRPDRDHGVLGEAASLVIREYASLLVLAVLTAASVHFLLGGGLPAPGEGNLPDAHPRLDVVFRSLPLSWEVPVAILWPLLVVWRGESLRKSPSPWHRWSAGSVVRRIVAGGLLFSGSMAAGSLVGISIFGATEAWPQLGDPGVPLAMLLTLTSLYLLASALAVGSRRPWRWLLVAYLVPNLLAPLLQPVKDWPLLRAIWSWAAVGELGPGTLLEAPALVGGLIREPQWEGVNPWATILAWLVASGMALWGTVRFRYGPGPTQK